MYCCNRISTIFAVLKTTNIILSIIIMIISCLPCADLDISNSSRNVTQFISNHNNHSNDQQNDFCSPFCTCNCCGVQVLNYASTSSFDFPVLVVITKSAVPNYDSVFASNFYGSIWQPPQIV